MPANTKKDNQTQQYSQVYGNLSTPQWNHSSSTTSLNSAGVGIGSQNHSASQMSLPATSQPSQHRDTTGPFDGSSQRHHRGYRPPAAPALATNTSNDETSTDPPLHCLIPP
ncbi:hypothetical protein FHG87_020952, partial [Trinorchestia longiramus]